MEKVEEKNKVLKRIGFIILVFFMLFMINYYRNYIIIKKVSQQQQQIMKYNNYSFISEYYDEGSQNGKTIIEHYHKDGKDLLIRNKDKKTIIWHDQETKEMIFLLPQTLTAAIQKNAEYMLGNQLPNILGSSGVAPDWAFALPFALFISSEQVNGQECYKVRWTLDGSVITWIHKETGMIVKSLNGKTVINGKEYQSIVEWKNLKVNKLTDKDMVRPNLTGYKVSGAQD